MNNFKDNNNSNSTKKPVNERAKNNQKPTNDGRKTNNNINENFNRRPIKEKPVGKV